MSVHGAADGAQTADARDHDAAATASAQLEIFLNDILAECNRVSKIKTDTITREVAMAKMINYCIRMLHSEGWIPRTIIRAMVNLETSESATVRSMMWKALRERREERRLLLKVHKDRGGSPGGSKRRRDSRQDVERTSQTSKAVNGTQEQNRPGAKNRSVNGRTSKDGDRSLPTA